MKCASFLVLACAALLVACDDDGHGHTGAESCQAIIDACHDVDPGSGEIHDCHNTAHDEGTAEACDPIKERCVMLCHELANADGGHGDHDAGH
jgi:hypothetical protein